MIFRPLKRHAPGLLLALMLFVVLGAQAQSGDTGLVRFFHGIPGASSVDIYTAGQLTAANLPFGEATEYVNVPAGQHRLTVTPNGVTTPLWEQDITVISGQAVTMVVSSFSPPVTFSGFADVLDPLPLGKARFTAIHAIADAPAVDIVLEDGRPVLPQLSYNQPAGTLDVPVFSYPMVVVPSGASVENALASLGPLPLNSGASYILVLYGTAAAPQAALLSSPTRPDGDSAFVRFAHGIPGAPGVDVVVNETVVATLTDPAGGRSDTRYLAVPPGTYSIAVRASGSTQNLTSASLTAAAGERFTAVALGSPEEVALTILGDSLGDISPQQTLLRIINGSAAPVSASLEDGTLIANNVAGGTASEIIAVEPNEQTIIFSGDGATLTTPAESFYGGAFYDVLVLDDAGSLLAVPASPAALAQGIASAPGAEALVVAAVPSPTPEPTVTPASQEAAQAATPAPTLPPAPTPAPAVDEDVLIGRVFNLNPDANLQLRQYPNSSALSLGTIAFGVSVRVNGRDGEIADLPLSSTRVPDDYEYVDPVTLLEDERADLERDLTWLYVTYDTPDGGQIDAWVRSDYIDVRDGRGEQIPLRNILTVPANTPGESRDTAVTAPTGRQNVVTVVVTNLAASANLNVRRAPSNESEVLAQLPLGTVAEFVGVGEGDIDEWIFLRFVSPDGVTVTGWSSAEFLTYQLNGAPTTTADLDARGLLDVVPDDERGEQTVGAVPVGQPTEDIVRNAIVATVALDPGANLNFRRDPSEQSEVIGQIPSGTRLVVSQRSGDGNWLNVTFEGVDGWIAARKDQAEFVNLTFNEQAFELLDVPIVEGDEDSARFTPTPTLPPALTPTPVPAG